jgi:hypothetical protein
MRKKLFFLLFVLATFNVKAQDFSSELWHQGMLVLVSEDTLSGKIKYNIEQDLVQIQSQNKTYTFSGKKLFYFQIFDETVDTYREFYTLPYALHDQYETPVIFEVLVEGKLTLLSREAIVTKTINDNTANPYRSTLSYSREVLVYTYYFLDVDGNIIEYSLKKRDLLRVLSKRSAKIEEYMKVNHLKADKRYDISRIISFYNGIL